VDWCAKSPVMSYKVLSTILPTTFEGSSHGISAMFCSPKYDGVYTEYHSLERHLSLTFLGAFDKVFPRWRAFLPQSALINVLGYSDRRPASTVERSVCAKNVK
jgi:hypothetical protein